MENQIQIESFWTDKLSCERKNNLINLANTVFGPFLTETYYHAKYVENIYGPSLATLVRVDGVAVGTNIMWRNDVDFVKAYQFADTCLLEPFRGKGLFMKLMAHVLDVLGDDLVYGFPGANSYPGCVKIGLHVEHLYKTICLFKNDAVIDDGYAAWWLRAQNGISYINKRGKYYLVRKNKSKPVATLLGRVSDATAQLFPKTEGLCLLEGFDTKSSIYNKNKSIPFVCNKKWNVPYWKIDAI